MSQQTLAYRVAELERHLLLVTKALARMQELLLPLSPTIVQEIVDDDDRERGKEDAILERALNLYYYIQPLET